MSYDVDSDPSVNSDMDTSRTVDRLSPGPSSLTMNSLPDPFSPSMNHVFFSGADRRILLDEVIHLCQFGNNLVAAIGDEGVGKTAFLNQARFELTETAFCCLIDGSESMTPEEIFSQIVSQLELPVSSVSSAGEMIATLRHAMAEDNMHRVVLIIDDAHLLSDAILSALISLLQGHQGQHLHILMGGEKDLVDRLDHFEMVDVLVYDVTLNPFTFQDTKDYLEFKFSTAGYPSETFLDDAQIESIWKESGGYPAQISLIAEKYIFQQDPDIAADDIKVAGLPLLHMALLVVLLAALIFALIYMGGDDPKGDGLNEQAITDPARETSSLDLPIGEPQKESTINENQSTPAPVISDVVEPAVNDSQSVENIQANAEPEKVVAEKTEEPGPSEAVVAKADGASVEEKKPAEADDKAEAAARGNTAEPAQAEPSQNLQESLRQELQKEAKSLGVDGPKPESPIKPSALSGDEKWLMALDDQRYVLQVIAAGQKASVQKFVTSQANKEALRLIEVGRNGKPWYIVVIGNYADTVSARRAIESLPQDQVNGGPWPRKVSDLKTKIEAFRSK